MFDRQAQLTGDTNKKQGKCLAHAGWHSRGPLTALDGIGGDLQGQRAAAGLRNVHPEHQPDACVLPADVRLPLPQLYVRIAQLQDAGAVNAAQSKARTSVPPGACTQGGPTTVRMGMWGGAGAATRPPTPCPWPWCPLSTTQTPAGPGWPLQGKGTGAGSPEPGPVAPRSPPPGAAPGPPFI